MAFAEKNVKYEDLMKLSKSHLALLILDHRKSITRIREPLPRPAECDMLKRKERDETHKNGQIQKRRQGC